MGMIASQGRDNALTAKPAGLTDQPAPSTMRAAVIQNPQQVAIESVMVPRPAPTQVRVRVEGCGVCASNLPLWEGRSWFNYPMPPGAPGHEAWGRIDAVGADVMNLSIGDRVAMISHSAYAEYDVAEAEAVVSLPPALAAKPFPGEPLGCAMNVFARSDIRPGHTVAIVGVGFLGAVVTRLAANAGARVIAISRRPFALDMARAFGAQQTIEMNDHGEIIEQVMKITENRGCERVVEAVGQQWPLDLAAELTRERGRLVVAGYHQDGLRQVNMQLWNWRGLDVINAHERDPRAYAAGIRAAIEAIAGGQLDPSPLYTHRFRLDQLGEALDAMRNRPDGFMKAMITL
jgi:threonine dehydrogenase-like Zn-dependent dehydrogenase